MGHFLDSQVVPEMAASKMARQASGEEGNCFEYHGGGTWMRPDASEMRLQLCSRAGKPDAFTSCKPDPSFVYVFQLRGLVYIHGAHAKTSASAALHGKAANVAAYVAP